MEKQKLIIDTDCGSDDAMAIAMALNDPAYDILMMVAVSGNVVLEQAATNALTTIEAAGTYEPPVYLGCRDMLLRELVFAHETHGADGMGDIGLVPKRLKVAEGNGVLKMIEALENSPEGTIEIVALGPLTNLAVAMRLAPAAMRRVKRLSIMGSAGLGVGNVTPLAEFNIWQDAEAAKIVLEFGVPTLLVGWDACIDEAMLEQEDLDRLVNSGPLGKFAVDCNANLMKMNRERFGRNCLDMADPAAMAAALYPACIADCDDYFCEVDATPGPSYGAVLVDRYHFSGKAPNAAVCSRLKHEAYKAYIFRTLGA